MSTTPQHEFHPDAELLSAFAEHALAESDRSRVLAHLAVCGRCRQVLAVAQQSAEVEVADLVAAAAPAAVAAPSLARRNSPAKWWRKWRLVWVPAAVAAAFAVTTLSIYLRQEGRNNTAITVAEKTPAPKIASAPTPSVTEPAKAAAPAPPSRNRVVARSAPSAPQIKASAAAPAAAPPPPLPPSSTTETVAVMQDSTAPETVSSQQLTRIEPRPLVQAKSLQSAAASSNAPLAKKRAQAELKEFAANNSEAEATAASNRLYTVSALPSQGEQSQKPSAASGANTSAAVYRQQPEMRDGSIAAFGSMQGVAGASVAAGKPIHLPSGLPVASLVSANHLLLAVDKAGTLFLSPDAGTNWKRVVPQWTGRAILVRTRPLPAPPAVAAPSAGTPVDSNGALQSSPQQVTIFEIVNDQNQVWLSTDGNTWTAK